MLRWLMMGALLWSGCEDRSSPQGSGASHWLLPCVSDADCGDALACLCGQCTAACEGACPVGQCVADGCGGEAVCVAEQSEPPAAKVMDDAVRVDDAWASGPVVEADNPRGVWQFHRPSIVDANVLELRADGTFVYTLGGCDAVECAWGQWATVAGTIRLTPPPDEAVFRWPDEFALDVVSAVVLSPAPEGMNARVTAPDRADFEQAWRSRGLSLSCVDWSVAVSDTPADASSCRAPAYPD